MTVKFYNDGGKKFYAWGREFGLEQIILTDSEYNARDIAVDECTPIADDEIPEAYNRFDLMAQWIADNNDNGISPDPGKEWSHYCDFIHEWGDVWWDIKCKEWQEQGEFPELDEAYSMQSNSTDSGIVATGHHEWWREATNKEVAQIPLSDLADYLEEWANEQIYYDCSVLIDGSWHSGQNSMIYALSSTGELVRGSIPSDENPVEWVHTLWDGLLSEVVDCILIAAEDSELQNDLFELEELKIILQRVVKRIDQFREILDENE